MITGALSYDISVTATNEKDLERISADIRAALKPIKGVEVFDEVDSNVEEIEDEE